MNKGCRTYWKQFKSLSDHNSDAVDFEAVRNCNGEEMFDIRQGRTLQELMSPAPEKHHTISDLSESLLITDSIIEVMDAESTVIHHNINTIRSLVCTGKIVKALLDISRLVRAVETVWWRMSICARQYAHADPRIAIRRQSLVLNSLTSEQIELRRRLLWLVVELDVHIGIYTGQPVSIAQQYLDEMEYPHLNDLQSDMKHLALSKLDFWRTAYDILSKIPQNVQGQANEVHNARLAELLDAKRLQRIQARMPKPSLESSKSHTFATAVAEHRTQFFAFRMLVACARADVLQSDLTESENTQRLEASPPSASTRNPSTKTTSQLDCQEIVRAAAQVLRNFEILAHLKARETSRWSNAFATFSAVSILAISLLRREANLGMPSSRIRKAELLFVGLSNSYCVSDLAKTAASRIGALRKEIESHRSRRLIKPDEPVLFTNCITKHNPIGAGSTEGGAECSSPAIAPVARKRPSILTESDTESDATTKRAKKENVQPVLQSEHSEPSSTEAMLLPTADHGTFRMTPVPSYEEMRPMITTRTCYSTTEFVPSSSAYTKNCTNIGVYNAHGDSKRNSPTANTLQATNRPVLPQNPWVNFPVYNHSDADQNNVMSEFQYYNTQDSMMVNGIGNINQKQNLEDDQFWHSQLTYNTARPAIARHYSAPNIYDMKYIMSHANHWESEPLESSSQSHSFSTNCQSRTSLAMCTSTSQNGRPYMDCTSDQAVFGESRSIDHGFPVYRVT